MHLTHSQRDAIRTKASEVRRLCAQIDGITGPFSDGDPLCTFERLQVLLDEIMTHTSAIRAIASLTACSGCGAPIHEPIIYCADCERFERSRRD